MRPKEPKPIAAAMSSAGEGDGDGECDVRGGEAVIAMDEGG